MPNASRTTAWLIAAALAAIASGPARADQLIVDDLIVLGSECVGFDCVNGESFGFDTIRLKENNTRIKFDDTSLVAGFPSVDWLLFANDSVNGGMNRFSIQDTTNNRTIFTLQAGAPSNAFFVESTGDVGFGTSVPVVDLHTVDGDTPTLRLDQNGSVGWAPQVWDIAGNETNFFLRDVTNGSSLPLRVRPGAPTNSVYVHTDGSVGLGTNSPDAKLDVAGNLALTGIRSTIFTHGDAVPGHSGGLQMVAAGDGAVFVMTPTDPAGTTLDSEIRFGGSGAFNGNIVNVRVSGQLITGGPTCSGGCDRVLHPDYGLPTIGEHARQMRELGHLPAIGPTEPAAPMNIAEKIGGLLNELEKAHLYIERLNQRIDALERRLADKG